MKEIEYLQQLVQVAKLYYEENMTQQEISKKIGRTRQNISKMLNEAKEFNIVEIKINDIREKYCDIEDRIKDIFPVKNVIIVPGYFEDEVLARKAVAKKAEIYINQLLDKNRIKKIGISWGRSLYSFTGEYQENALGTGKEIIPLIGSSDRTAAYFTINEMVRILAGKTKSKAHFINFPLEPLSPDDYQLFIKTQAYKDTLEKWKNIDLAIVGIGTTDNLQYRSFYPGENKILSGKSNDIVGDICTHYFNLKGEMIETKEMTSMLHIPCSDLKKIKRIVALVNGKEKINAVIGALRLGIITDIILDESLGRGIIEAVN